MRAMSAKNKQSNAAALKLVSLAIGGLVLGAAIPIASVLLRSGTNKSYLAVMEAAGAAALIYVFGAYVFKR